MCTWLTHFTFHARTSHFTCIVHTNEAPSVLKRLPTELKRNGIVPLWRIDSIIMQKPMFKDVNMVTTKILSLVRLLWIITGVFSFDLHKASCVLQTLLYPSPTAFRSTFSDLLWTKPKARISPTRALGTRSQDHRLKHSSLENLLLHEIRPFHFICRFFDTEERRKLQLV